MTKKEIRIKKQLENVDNLYGIWKDLPKDVIKELLEENRWDPILEK